MKNYRAIPRGLGSDVTPGCYCCGGKLNLYTNMSFFVTSREDGEAVADLFSKGARLDYRPHEPNWIQVKVGACETHVNNLNRLMEMVFALKDDEGFCLINQDLIQKSRE